MRLTRQISQVVGRAGALAPMTSITRAAGASAPDRIDGFQVPQIVSDSMMVDITGFIDRLGAIPTTTVFILALFAPILILAVLVGLRDIGERTSNWTVRTRPDNVFKFERRAQSQHSRVRIDADDDRPSSQNKIMTKPVAASFGASCPTPTGHRSSCGSLGISPRPEADRICPHRSNAELISLICAALPDTRSDASKDGRNVD